MTTQELEEMIYNAAMDGIFTNNDKVINWLAKMDKVEKEIIEFVYNEGWNEGVEEEI